MGNCFLLCSAGWKKYAAAAASSLDYRFISVLRFFPYECSSQKLLLNMPSSFLRLTQQDWHVVGILLEHSFRRSLPKTKNIIYVQLLLSAIAPLIIFSMVG